MTAATLERVETAAAALGIDGADAPLHLASLTLHVTEALSAATEHAVMFLVERNAFLATEAVNEALRYRTAKAAGEAVSQMEQLKALMELLHLRDEDGEWEALDAAAHLLGEALASMYELSKGWQ